VIPFGKWFITNEGEWARFGFKFSMLVRRDEDISETPKDAKI